ncbi:MAG: phosphoribosylanthranilate isomerase, partial [Prevotella sp.]|nr:phosphoribosylanthranilate isomerase [Prevotella sp.]
QPSTLNSQHSTLNTQPSTLNPQRSPQRVGVFVDEMPQTIITHVVNFQLDVVQLHGHESPTVIRNLRATLDPDIRPGILFWKAISIAAAEDLDQCQQYEDCVDAFVFDTRSPSVGGSGQHFDWQLLDAYRGNVPFLLSGGIGPDDAARIKSFRHPQCMGIDLNSRFETAPAVKDAALISRFLAQF